MVGCVQEESIPADMDPITLFQFFDGFCLITVLSTLDFVFLDFVGYFGSRLAGQ